MDTETDEKEFVEDGEAVRRRVEELVARGGVRVEVLQRSASIT